MSQGIICLLCVTLSALVDGQPTKYVLGEIEHDWRVENGEAIITVPIPFPKGVNGLTPAIKLEYRSNNQMNRELGLGWRLAGFSDISRCHKSVALDGKYEPYSFWPTDAFCFDGQRLLLHSSNGSVSEYTTEIDNYQRIMAFGFGRSNDMNF